MNDYRPEGNPYCYLHPKQIVVGVCSVCLKEKLVVLASKQGQHHGNKDGKRSFRYLRRKPTINRLKVFAISTFLNLLEPRHSTSNYKDVSDDDDDDGDNHSTASFEDSFISIKFEENGHAAWDYKKPTNNVKCSAESNYTTGTKSGKEIKSMVGHMKHSSALRWRKRIGQLLQLAKWKTYNKANTCHVGHGSKMDGFKGRRNWITSLTRRTTIID